MRHHADRPTREENSPEVPEVLRCQAFPVVFFAAVAVLTAFFTVFFAVLFPAFFPAEDFRAEVADFFGAPEPPSAASLARRSLSSSLAWASVIVSGVSPRRSDAFVVPSVT